MGTETVREGSMDGQRYEAGEGDGAGEGDEDGKRIWRSGREMEMRGR